MAVVIRLSGTGTKKKIKHRIVVTDKRNPRDGAFIENLGYWNPNTEPEDIRVDAERAKFWMGKGARPSPTVLRLFKKAGITSA